MCIRDRRWGAASPHYVRGQKKDCVSTLSFNRYVSTDASPAALGRRVPQLREGTKEGLCVVPSAGGRGDAEEPPGDDAGGHLATRRRQPDREDNCPPAAPGRRR